MNNNSMIVLPLSQKSFRPYLLQSLLDWCENEGYTPYMLVSIDDATEVPREYLNPDNTIVLCVSSEATKDFEITAEAVTFEARFGEAVRRIYIPLGRVAAVYPRENTDLVSYFPVYETEEKAPQKSDDDDDLPVFTKV